MRLCAVETRFCSMENRFLHNYLDFFFFFEKLETTFGATLMGRSFCWKKTQTVAECSNVQLKGKTRRTIWIGHMV